MEIFSVILLADDDVAIRNLVRRVLQNEGYAVLVAADGSEAIELAETHQGNIDLLLTDVMMPEVDGISAYREISARRPSMKVLFMLGHVSPPIELPQYLPFLQKPFVPEALRSRVSEILAVRPPPPVKVILVVDHHEDRRERTRDILLGGGYAVLTTSSVEEAETISDSIAKIDLIISEVIFPGKTGVNLAEHVETSSREISTLLISHFHPDILRTVAGFPRQPEFLQNPFTPEALLTRVRRLLER